jgi:hypothetical protein
MRNEVVASLLVVAVIASAGIGYLVGISTRQPTCESAPQGSVLYVKITHGEAKTPVTNATVNAVPVETCGGVNTTIAILMQPTVNAAGVATLDASSDTFYGITVLYGGQSYSYTAYVQHSLDTCADISVPSGSSSIAPC